MSNKVLISAAGRGTRMLHLSGDKPKHLIKVNGHPFLYYLLHNLKEAGWNEIIMVVGYKRAVISDFLHEYGKQFNITLLNQFDILGEDEYGTACPLKCAKGILKKDNFLAIYGDNLYSVKDLQEFHQVINDDYCYIAGLPHDHPENYGVLQVNTNGTLKNIVEKPKQPIGNLINTGLYKFTPAVFEYINKITLSPRNEYELTDVITLLAKQGKVKVKSLQGKWLDFGNPQDVQIVSDYLNNK